jgi:hypothetical protein
MDEYGALVEWQWEGKIEVHGGKTVPEPLGPPQISNALSWDRTQDSTAQRHLTSKLSLTHRQWYCSLHGRTTFQSNRPRVNRTRVYVMSLGKARQGRCFAAKDHIKFHINPRMIFGRQGGTRPGLPAKFRFFSVIYHSLKSAYFVCNYRLAQKVHLGSQYQLTRFKYKYISLWY